MKFLTALLALLPLVAGQDNAAGGSGAYPAHWTTSTDLPNHTIYRPVTLPAGQRLPVVVWGNGMCLALGTLFSEFLREIASHGFIVLASGAPSGLGITTSAMLTQSIDWASRPPTAYAAAINSSSIAVAGQSCGGLEAIQVSGDSRITFTALFNSGLTTRSQNSLLRAMTKPVFYLEGGPSDGASANGAADYVELPATTKAWMGNFKNVGHLATYWTETNAGEFGTVAVELFSWMLKNDQSQRSKFLGSPPGLEARGWDIEYKNW